MLKEADPFNREATKADLIRALIDLGCPEVVVNSPLQVPTLRLMLRTLAPLVRKGCPESAIKEALYAVARALRQGQERH